MAIDDSVQTYGDHARCKQAYFETYPGLYFTGDGCRRDENDFTELQDVLMM